MCMYIYVYIRTVDFRHSKLYVYLYTYTCMNKAVDEDVDIERPSAFAFYMGAARISLDTVGRYERG